MLLSSIVFFPLLFSLLICFWVDLRALRILSLIFSLIEFFLSLGIFLYFDPSSPGIQLVEKYPWIERFGISYFLGVDGLSLWLVILTTFIVPLALLSSWSSIYKSLKGFLVSVFILETAMLGSFLALDAILFYLFWELSLIPMYFIIGIWGGPRRVYASIKFFLYTMLGSVLMLLAIIYMMFLTQASGGTISSSLFDFYKISIPFVGKNFFSLQTLLFFAFAGAFAIKVPLFPFHTWLPDAHVEAPTPGSVILAALMLKMGTYGFLRWTIPLFPEAAAYWGPLFLSIGAVGIVYGALVAMVQSDMKKLVAYSSVSHMGYVLVGLFSLNAYGASGALYQMLSHGISTGALFLLVGFIYERTHTREISAYGGLAEKIPVYAVCFFLVTMSSIAVPLTNGFVGEFLVLLGAYRVNPIIAGVAVLGVILGATYMLWMYKKVFFGPSSSMVATMSRTEGDSYKVSDMGVREVALLLPLLILIFLMGVFPNFILGWSKSSLDHWSKNWDQYELEIKSYGSPGTGKGGDHQ